MKPKLTIARLLTAPLLLALLASCNKPEDNPSAAGSANSAAAAAQQDSIDFSQAAYPGSIKEVRGMSGPEPKGRWTDGPSAVFVFKEALHGKVQLSISALPYEANAGKEVVFALGGVQKSLVFKPNLNNFQTLSAEFDLPAPSDTLEIRIPEPTLPPGGNRRLGLFIASIKLD